MREVFRLALGAPGVHLSEHGAAVHALQVWPQLACRLAPLTVCAQGPDSPSMLLQAICRTRRPPLGPWGVEAGRSGPPWLRLQQPTSGSPALV